MSKRIHEELRESHCMRKKMYWFIPEPPPELNPRSCFTLRGKRQFLRHVAAEKIDLGRRSAPAFSVCRPPKVLVDRIDRIWLQLCENAAQTVFDTVDGEEIRSAIHVKMLAAEVAVGSQKVMVPQKFVPEIIEGSLTDQAKVGEEL